MQCQWQIWLIFVHSADKIPCHTSEVNYVCMVLHCALTPLSVTWFWHTGRPRSSSSVPAHTGSSCRRTANTRAAAAGTNSNIFCQPEIFLCNAIISKYLIVWPPPLRSRGRSLRGASRRRPGRSRDTPGYWTPPWHSSGETSHRLIREIATIDVRLIKISTSLSAIIRLFSQNHP